MYWSHMSYSLSCSQFSLHAICLPWCIWSFSGLYVVFLLPSLSYVLSFILTICFAQFHFYYILIFIVPSTIVLCLTVSLGTSFLEVMLNIELSTDHCVIFILLMHFLLESEFQVLMWGQAAHSSQIPFFRTNVLNLTWIHTSILWHLSLLIHISWPS